MCLHDVGHYFVLCATVHVHVVFKCVLKIRAVIRPVRSRNSKIQPLPPLKSQMCNRALHQTKGKRFHFYFSCVVWTCLQAGMKVCLSMT